MTAASAAPAAGRLCSVGTDDRLVMRIERGSSAEIAARMLRLCFPDATTVLDATWGRGGFWKPAPAGLTVIGLDRSPHGRPSVLGDFTRLPFGTGGVQVVVLDPPFQWDEGKSKRSIVGTRFSTYRDEAHARESIRLGVREAWRVASVGILVKVQTYVHASRLVRLPRWVEDAIAPAELFDEVYLESPSKPNDPKWSGSQLSVRSNATTWMAFRHDGPVHKRRARKGA
jgi:hypothetical protein